MGRQTATEKTGKVPISFSEGTFGKLEPTFDPGYCSDKEEDKIAELNKAGMTPTFGADFEQEVPALVTTEIEAPAKIVEKNDNDIFNVNKKIIKIKQTSEKTKEGQQPKKGEERSKNTFKNQFFRKYIEKPLENKKEALKKGIDPYQYKKPGPAFAKNSENYRQVKDEIKAISQKIINREKPAKGKALAPKNIKTFMDSDKKKNFKRGTGLMPRMSNVLIRKDLTPYDSGLSKKVATFKNGIVNIENLHLNTSMMTESSMGNESSRFPRDLRDFARKPFLGEQEVSEYTANFKDFSKSPKKNI